ncbi:MAG TPA: 16S rRNA (guanine(527)-N(7))-methyltransferase RsmG [Bacteroidales bacterium]|nr:MAG: 16S rRNA (guanine(527)-N(7))-methyltransferase [Bacteroidetes bacterium GWE2_42_24]OFY27525.1 MAG: 16S rRNA (guanine(527)-N(7))-methyltransferase [Bacteroidetes bacterium GWF2_43_11]HAQ64995.1 16S rRNA (guanine(527)-N(7))-methyltransferase RsmG [Bacteroidales bacterium]HBZ66048.1 16S rRNA (guanine(527)-N(7))-methyltransferase RsmG [Bacteroidales bacterium]
MEIISKYFPTITSEQKEKFSRLQLLYTEWNEKINVISRKDIDNLYLHHVLHSLSIARIVRFQAGTYVLDVGTGGGFPGIPLAIFFPDTQFTLIDSIGKKIKVVEAISAELGLENVEPRWGRVQDVTEKYDFVVSRAVTKLPDFYEWVKCRIRKEEINHLHNGILYIKGGPVEEELQDLNRHYHVYHLSNFFYENFFDTKAVVHIY